MVSLRIQRFKETLDKYPIKTIVIEGFPFVDINMRMSILRL